MEIWGFSVVFSGGVLGNFWIRRTAEVSDGAETRMKQVVIELDLNSLKTDKHKFESHYTDNIVGSEEAYFKRSPINFVDKFSCPVILFQGLEDKVVTPDQARKIYTALKQKGLPVALVEYEGEQHGLAASS
ncbi:hypothetical protein MKW98_019889 [Papaver atlanticum]|uniref:Peptidase S9 prolyl oligopeptidase catalytic domain-containing protein n=1 Tax=Papaver atlanticum TaxID=357466 RepID=A0AAD4S1V9_9MAGN|nr:hypothetical protein MKW98_019889 [Papaver atlanticum]